MKVRSEKKVKHSLIQESLEKIDFQDTFSTTNHVDPLEKIFKKVFGHAPWWIRALMNLRNFIVRFFGLKAAKGEAVERPFKEGEIMGFFNIITVAENEAILGADDSHLKFRVGILNDQSSDEFNVKVTTVVQYENRFGKIYMTIIRPFHKLLVKRMVRQAYQA